MKAVAIIFSAGLIIGIVGGLVNGETWFYEGVALIAGGVAALFGYAIYRRPDAVLDMMTDRVEDDPQSPPVDAFTMENELKRKDRGEVRSKG